MDSQASSSRSASSPTSTFAFFPPILPGYIHPLSPPRVPSPPSSGGKDKPKCIKFDLSMDLILLRQLRGGTNPFLRGSPGYEEAALALDSLGDPRFAGITKKGSRDRTLLMLEAHQKGDLWKKKQSGSDEEFTEKVALMTELADLKYEASEKSAAKQVAPAADRQAALLLRDEATSTLGPVKRKSEKSDDATGMNPKSKKQDAPKASACEVVVGYLEEKSKVELEETQRRRELEERRVAVDEKRLQEEFSDESKEIERRKMALEEQRLEAQKEKERGEREEARAERAARQKRAEAKADREAREKRDGAMMELLSKLVAKQANYM
eukprot:scpid77857/ scgid1945/ 